MKMLNNDPLDLSGDQDETITISVTSNYPGGPAYNMNLNGSSFTDSSFKLDKKVKNPYQLLVSVMFKTNNQAARCQIQSAELVTLPAWRHIIEPRAAHSSFMVASACC